MTMLSDAVQIRTYFINAVTVFPQNKLHAIYIIMKDYAQRCGWATIHFKDKLFCCSLKT